MAIGQEAAPVWTINVHQQFGLRDFGVASDLLWSWQEGVVFLGDDRLALYQVNQKLQPSPLAHRDASGGAGNFKLDVEVLDAVRGRTLQQYRLPTSAGFSSIVALRNGRFVIRTGDLMYLCAADAKVLATRRLLLEKDAPTEFWRVQANSAGTQLLLLHAQVFTLPDPFPVPHEGLAQIDFEVLDPDTLVSVRTFKVPHYLATWSVGQDFLVAPNPQYSGPATQLGMMDFAGAWKPLFPQKSQCAFPIADAAGSVAAVFGCGELIVFSREGEKLFSANLGLQNAVGITGNEQYVAVELARHESHFSAEMGRQVEMVTPVRLELYDWKNNRHLLSIPLHSVRVQFAVSADGNLAVMDGQELSLFRTEK